MPASFNSGVEWAYEYIVDIADGEECLLEENVSYDRGDQLLYSGYADVICGNHILDYKESSQGYYRPQLNGYAAAYMQQTFKPEVTCHVLFGQTQRADVWTITAEEADEYVAKMFKIIEDENKKPSANEYCKWCAKISSCDGVNDLMLKAIEGGLMFNFDSPERLADARSILPVIKAWVDGVDKLSKKTLEDGGEVPGYKLSKRSGRQFVSKDFWEELAMVMAMRNFDTLEALEMCSITVPKAKEIYKKITTLDLPEEFLPRGKDYSVVVADKNKKIE